jgi:O-antigen/teichoic acid export membrane protein
VLLVIFSSDKIVAFFGWQLFMSFLNVIAIAILLWKAVPRAPRSARFDTSILKSLWRLAFGMSAVSVTVLLFNQMDKVILSRQVSLSAFGYYSLAWQVVAGLFLFYYPIYSAYFPAITQAYSQGDKVELANLYHKSSQLMSVAVLPVAAVIFFFSKDILRLWTQDAATSDQCHLILSMLIVGAAFNGMFYIPYALRQAAGSMRRLLQFFIPSLIVFSVLLAIVASRYGMEGAALLFSVFSMIQVGIARRPGSAAACLGVRGRHREMDCGRGPHRRQGSSRALPGLACFGSIRGLCDSDNPAAHERVWSQISGSVEIWTRIGMFRYRAKTVAKTTLVVEPDRGSAARLIRS